MFLTWTVQWQVIIILFGFSSGEETLNINILFINDIGNTYALNAMNDTLNYIKSNQNFGISVNMLSNVEFTHTEEAMKYLLAICKVYDNAIVNKQPPHLIIDTTILGLLSETVKSFTSALALPTISASYGFQNDIREWRNLTNNKDKFLLQILPPADTMPQVIRSIVQYMNLTEMVIWFDDLFVLNHKYKSLLSNLPMRHIMKKIPAGFNAATEIRNQMNSFIWNLDIKTFSLLGSIQSINSVLDCTSPEHFDKDFVWYVITPFFGDNPIECKYASLILINPERDVAPEEPLNILQPQLYTEFYFDFMLRAILSIRDLMKSKTWPHNFKYLKCDEYNSTNPPQQSIDLQSFFINMDNPEPTYGTFSFPDNEIFFNGNSYFEYFMQIRHINIENSKIINDTYLGKWKAGITSPIVVFDKEIMKHLATIPKYRVYTISQSPFVIRDELYPKNYKGYAIDVLDIIAKEIGFTYVIYEEDEKNDITADKRIDECSFGELNETGHWNGVIRKLINGEADILIGAISVRSDREEVIDFTVPFYDAVGISILMQIPKTTSSLFKFLNVIETNVWLCILGAYLFTSLLLWIIDRWSPFSYQNNRDKYNNSLEKREFNLRECLWFCVTSLTPQGGGEVPKTISGRIVVAVWWLFGFVIIASYTANLSAFLTVVHLDTPISSLDDLISQYRVSYAPVNGSYAMKFFQRMANIELRFYEIWKKSILNDSMSTFERARRSVNEYPISRKYIDMWQSIMETGLPNTMADGVARVRQSTKSTGFALLADSIDIKYLVQTNCDLEMVGDELSRQPLAFALPENSKLKELMNMKILQLVNNRRLEELKEKWWPENSRDHCEKAGQSLSISIENIGGVFILIFIGTLITFGLLAIELYKKRKANQIRMLDVPQINNNCN